MSVPKIGDKVVMPSLAAKEQAPTKAIDLITDSGFAFSTCRASFDAEVRKMHLGAVIRVAT